MISEIQKRHHRLAAAAVEERKHPLMMVLRS